MQLIALAETRLRSRLEQQIRWLLSQRLSYASKVQESQVPLSAFDPPHMRSIDMRSVGQGFLRKFQRFSLGPHHGSDRFQQPVIKFSGDPGHPCKFLLLRQTCHGIYDPNVVSIKWGGS